MLQPPAAALSRELVSLSSTHSCGRIVCVILIPSGPSQVSYLSNSLKCFTSVPNSCPDVGIWPLLQVQIQSYSLSFFSPASFLCSTEFCIILYILFWWRGTPACSQLVFCRIFSVWRYIPDAFMERDELHIHLLLCHLGSLQNCVWIHIHRIPKLPKPWKTNKEQDFNCQREQWWRKDAIIFTCVPNYLEALLSLDILKSRVT